FSPNGSKIATGGDGGAITLWDRSNGQKLSSAPAHPPRTLCVCFSSDGRLLASSGLDGVVKLWDITFGPPKLRHSFRGHTGWATASFTRDARRLLCTNG